MGTLKIIMVAFQRVIPLRIAIDCLLLQTDKRWELHIIHDGKTPPDVKRVVSERADPRIHFVETPEVNGSWGHPNRRYMIEHVEAEDNDFILLTNDDNYYVPTFVSMIREAYKSSAGIIYYNTLHNYFEYIIHESRLKECCIDMGAFVVRADVAKSVGFNFTHTSADGRYAEQCADYCHHNGLEMIYIPRKVPFIHN